MGTEKIKRTLCLGTQQKLSVLLNPRFLRVDISIPCLACAQKSLHLLLSAISGAASVLRPIWPPS